jgi:hypothetical protein
MPDMKFSAAVHAGRYIGGWNDDGRTGPRRRRNTARNQEKPEKKYAKPRRLPEGFFKIVCIR